MEGVGHKLAVLFKGPGWSPGKPRLGCRDEIPQVRLNTCGMHQKQLPLTGLLNGIACSVSILFTILFLPVHDIFIIIYSISI